MSDTTTPCGCPEYTSISRRGLVGGALLAGGALTLSQPGQSFAVSTSRSLRSRLSPTGAVLVVLSLRGAADGLSLVVPHGDPVYYAARPRLAIPQASLLAPDPMFGLHPEMAPLLPMWESGRLAAVHATGMAAPNRSHIAAMEAVEDAAPGSSTRNGWLNRLLGQLPGASPLQGTAFGNAVPTALFGPEPAFAVRRVDDADIAGVDKNVAWRQNSLDRAWKGDRKMGKAVRDALTGAANFAPAKAVPGGAPTPAYPNSDLGRAMKEVSRMVRANVGIDVVTVDQGDWDMHTDAGTLEWGQMKRNVSDLASALAAFFADLGTWGERVTLVALSEFGRRVKENDAYGTDHGFGNVMFVAGAGVKGGRYYGNWPGLSDTWDADVLVTTDYRSVLSEVVTRRFGVSTASVFPGFTPTSVGLMA